MVDRRHSEDSVETGSPVRWEDVEVSSSCEKVYPLATLRPSSREGDSGSSRGVPTTKAEAQDRVRVKATSRPRSGCPADANFPTVSLIPARVFSHEKEGRLDTFYDELVCEMYRHDITRDKLSLCLPTAMDRAHDSDKGLCVYWKMPKCGFRLPINPFEEELLKTLDVPPSQLTSTSWCTIASFGRIFSEFGKELGYVKPTIALFAHFFTVAVTSKDFMSIKKKVTAPSLFDTVGNPRLQKIDAWNEDWAYITTPGKVRSLDGLRISWRVLGENSGGKPSLPSAMSPEESYTASRLEEFAKGNFLGLLDYPFNLCMLIHNLLAVRGPLELAFDGSSVNAKSLDPLKQSSFGKNPEGACRNLKRNRPAPTRNEAMGSASKKLASVATPSTPLTAIKPQAKAVPPAPGPQVEPDEEMGSASKKPASIATPSTAKKPQAQAVPPASGPQVNPASGTSNPHSRTQVPRGAKTGFVFKEGLSTVSADTVGVFLPGYTQMRQATGEPSGLGEFT